MNRIRVEKISTGAIWSSLDGVVWRKEWLGSANPWTTQGPGVVTTNFNPFSKRNLKRFRLVGAS